MPKEFTLTLEGSLEVGKAIQALGAKAPLAVAAALFDEANELKNDSLALVPRDTGNLARSAHVEPPKPSGAELEVIVGYGGAAAAYALAVHENPRAGHTGGLSPSGRQYQHWASVGEWKYLETPFKARVSGFLSRMAARLRASLLAGG